MRRAGSCAGAQCLQKSGKLWECAEGTGKSVDGLLNVYKERGFTSHDVVAKLRGILRQRKIGHTGTLDPDAEGVLPVCLGKATKACGFLADKDKEYRAVLRLGVATDTQDISGRVLRECAVDADEAAVREVVPGFVGEYEQLPPMYSAIKVNGKKLYELARQGKEAERQPRKVHIHGITIEQMDLPHVTMTICCSKGTYIRTLCHDIGERLGCGGCMEALVRTRVAEFRIETAKTLGQLEEMCRAGTVGEAVVAVDTLFRSCPAFCVAENAQKWLYNGNPLAVEFLVPMERTAASVGQMVEGISGYIRIYDSEGRFIGLYSYDRGHGCCRPERLFIP